jgi:hypothetical protein
MKSNEGSYLPGVKISGTFVCDVQRSLGPGNPARRLGELEMSSAMAAALTQKYTLLALVGEVDDATTNLNIVLMDLDKLSADPFAFGDTNPFARFKFLMRAAHAEFEHSSEFFARFLRLCAYGQKLSPPERRRLKLMFEERIYSLLASGEPWESTGTGEDTQPDGYGVKLRGVAYIKSRIAAAEPAHTTLVEWTKLMRPRVQSSRRRIFDVGTQVGKV